MKLLVVEVNHLEIVITRELGGSGRLPGATVEFGGFARYALKKICFWAINIGNDKTENTATLFITHFYGLLASVARQNLSLDGQFTSELGADLVGGSALSVICECTIQRATRWPTC